MLAYFCAGELLGDAHGDEEYELNWADLVGHRANFFHESHR